MTFRLTEANRTKVTNPPSTQLIFRPGYRHRRNAILSGPMNTFTRLAAVGGTSLAVAVTGFAGAGSAFASGPDNHRADNHRVQIDHRDNNRVHRDHDHKDRDRARVLCFRVVRHDDGNGRREVRHREGIRRDHHVRVVIVCRVVR